MIFRMTAGQDRLIGCNRRKPVSVELIIGNYININPDDAAMQADDCLPENAAILSSALHQRSGSRASRLNSTRLCDAWQIPDPSGWLL